MESAALLVGGKRLGEERLDERARRGRTRQPGQARRPPLAAAVPEVPQSGHPLAFASLVGLSALTLPVAALMRRHTRASPDA
ncbi:hypothetical protein [Allosalinactinospora lopnorensis]|uniref:hypothetical protein n=1 Tax=Allosalinactinospora lopnorensis TaxID=1352348 RepID=UPI000623FDD3|nr:hypothetical protein [Allosalinactinospora lopnorensis]